MKKILVEAHRVALKNLHKHPLYLEGRKLHFSFVVQKNQIIDWGCNMLHEPPIHMGYSQRINGAKARLHSEIVAYKKAKGLLSDKKFHLINIRLNKQAQIRLSKPCICCHEILSSLGCNDFYYSMEEGFGRI
jgi:hypothetical protein